MSLLGLYRPSVYCACVLTRVTSIESLRPPATRRRCCSSSAGRGAAACWTSSPVVCWSTGNQSDRMSAEAESKLQLVRRHIRAFPDFPRTGILFRDICPLLKDPAALSAAIDLLEDHVKKNHQQIDLIVGLDARGFLFGPLLSQRLSVGFVLVRKKGKLPGETVSVEYTLEYSTAEAEVQQDAVSPGQKVLIIDDLLATGGTLCAACELMEKQQAQILGCLVVVELKDLGGADRLKPHSVFSLVQY
ncbi:adenine phosphoribosyltransferase isoform X2 [Centropristis striata]|uniref:adenine phosphoribosyltransferase isoform X2 n=1 Tax=Centropristis striata TaxID=184440 RepID=UPI0027E100EA|nr:adenine phosphoribosyltransferase isoform X2 [Centropristis striata]